MKKNHFKRSIISIILATLIVFSTLGFAPIKNVEAKTVVDNNLRSREVLATASKKLTSSTGTLSVYLGSGRFFAKLHASASGGSGLVSCSVNAPNGETYNLGSFRANGSYQSIDVELPYAKKGTYTFYFENSLNETYYVVGSIYK